MSKKRESGAEWFYRVAVPKITSVGASVVIVGALFKIMHWKFAGEMLTVGLLTEAFIFLLGAFQPAPPPEAHYEWERVYPELADENAEALPAKHDSGLTTKLASTGALVGLDQMLAEANLSTDSFKSFGQGIKTLNDSALKMRDMSDAANASSDYATNLKSASGALVTLNKAYAGTVEAMSSMANAAKDAKDYHVQVQLITKNLGSLNAVYEMELKDANSHLKAMNKFYSNLTLAMESMAEASKESQVFKEQMTKLTGNLTTLNRVYGNMLTAMKG
ncbi:MAG: gliding motility protein GldL [Bernardetiaceae bacterium]|jgi:gliding motility-associated protein GldL|nr:gliding motility protein GldL [Bernardetiaceae bacterium]